MMGLKIFYSIFYFFLFARYLFKFYRELEKNCAFSPPQTISKYSIHKTQTLYFRLGSANSRLIHLPPTSSVAVVFSENDRPLCTNETKRFFISFLITNSCFKNHKTEARDVAVWGSRAVSCTSQLW